MPRRVHVEKPEKCETPLAVTVEEIGDSVNESPMYSSTVKPTMKMATPRKPRVMKKKSEVVVDERGVRKQRAFVEYISGANLLASDVLRDIAPDMVLDGWSVFIRCENVPDFGEPLTAEFALVRGDACSRDQVSITQTVVTPNILRDAPALVCALVDLHRTLNSDAEEE